MPGYPVPPVPPGLPGQPGQVGAGYPPAGQPPKKRRGLLIASLSLVVVILLCGGGGLSAFLLLRDAEDGEGAPEPVVAVESFLRAVYTDKDAAEAAALVCQEARDRAELDRKVAEVEGYAETYRNPAFRWETPVVEEENPESAVVTTKLIMTTGDEKVSEQPLRFTVVRKTGWWVCEVA
nr:hypothetical protein [Micromonospora sp. DSM 115978]